MISEALKIFGEVYREKKSRTENSLFGCFFFSVATYCYKELVNFAFYFGDETKKDLVEKLLNFHKQGCFWFWFFGYTVLWILLLPTANLYISRVVYRKLLLPHKLKHLRDRRAEALGKRILASTEEGVKTHNEQVNRINELERSVKALKEEVQIEANQKIKNHERAEKIKEIFRQENTTLSELDQEFLKPIESANILAQNIDLQKNLIDIQDFHNNITNLTKASFDIALEIKGIQSKLRTILSRTNVE